MEQRKSPEKNWLNPYLSASRHCRRPTIKLFQETNVEMQENRYLNCKQSTMKVFRISIAHSVTIRREDILSKYYKKYTLRYHFSVKLAC